ncbi:hypothetical protein M885DRAFT_615941 [Pelagophyceae sp. CCMP2097]|nr:hypothetical protein M885DRAFT_615941 [Pelagophyceae sp. CCMP2097]
MAARTQARAQAHAAADSDAEIKARGGGSWAVFDFYDTNCDGLVEAAMASRLLKQLGFAKTDFPDGELVSRAAAFPEVLAVSVALDDGKGLSSRTSRAFNLMVGPHDRTKRWCDGADLQKFLGTCGMELSEDHAERIAEIVSTGDTEKFTEQDLTKYVLSNQAAKGPAKGDRRMSAFDDFV